MEYLPIITSAILIHLFAMMSPGPNFIMAVRNSLIYSRKAGIFTAIGFSLALVVHVFYCIAGLGIIISKSIILFNVIKFLGAGYLIFIGIKSFRLNIDQKIIKEEHSPKDISGLKAIKIGFLTNILNPKSTLFFLSLFTFVIEPDVPLKIQLLISFIMVINVVIWFSLVSIFFTQKRIQRGFYKYQKIFNRFFGSLLIAIGLKILLTES